MNLWRVASVLCLIAIESLIYGFSFPFFSLALAQQGLASWLIGLNASLAVAGLLFVGLLMPGLTARFGVHSIVASLFAVSVLSLAAILLADDLVIWFVARFVLGTCIAALWTTTEALLSNLNADRFRNHLAHSSAPLFAAGAFVGPLLLGVVGVGGWQPFAVAMALLAAGSVVAISIQSTQRPSEDEDHLALEERNFGLALSIAGGLIAAAFLCGVGKGAMLSLLPLYGIARGFDNAGSASLVALFFLGEAIIVVATGWLATRYASRLIMRICAVVAGVSTLAAPLTGEAITLIWVAIFIAGGTMMSTFTLSIAYIRQTLRSYRLAVVSSGLASAYAVGMVAGPPPLGYFMDLLGPEALPLLLALGFFGLSLHLFFGANRRVRDWRDAEQTMPNLKYLEDVQFDEDADNGFAETLQHTEQEDFSPADVSPFEPEPPPVPTPAETVRTRNIETPLIELEAQLKRRQAEISESVAKRHEARDLRRNRPRAETPSAPTANNQVGSKAPDDG